VIDAREKKRAKDQAEGLTNLLLAEKLRWFADDIEGEGRTHLPAVMREAASRLESKGDT